jgi:hypothetical protein
MQLENLNNELRKFGKFVIQQARTRLTKNKSKTGKGTTSSKGQLYKSLEYVLEEDKGRLFFEMEDYGMYQDRGVSGTKKKYKTPFSYTSKGPPTKALADWAFKKRLLRDEQGKFTKGSYTSLGFIIARSIKEKGLKPSLFFTKPFEQAFKKLPLELVEAFGDDINNTFKDS